MKAVVGLFVFFLVLGLIAYWAGLFDMPEPPEEAAKNMRSNITPGMTWEQVVDYKEPREYAIFDYSNPNSLTNKHDAEYNRDQLTQARRILKEAGLELVPMGDTA